MKKKAFVAGLIGISFSVVNAQVYKGQIEIPKLPAPVWHYQKEYTFDSSLNGGAWSAQKRGLHISFGSTDELYFRTEVPELEKEQLTSEATVWKGERLNSQILIWSPDTLEQVRLILSDFKNDKGQVIGKNNIQLNLVRYVVSNYPYGAKDATCGESTYKSLYLIPDRFEPIGSTNDRFDVPGKTIRPIWFSLE